LANRKVITLSASALALACALFNASPSFAASSKPEPAAASPSAIKPTISPPGMRYLPDQPMLLANVQPKAAENFLNMASKGAKSDASSTDMIAGVFQVLNDQVDGPLSVGLYPDGSGKPGALLLAAHLKQAEMTRELLSGAAMMQGDDQNGPQKETYRGQTLYSIAMPKTKANSLSIPLLPTFTVTDNNYLIIGTALEPVKQALDAGASSGRSLASRADIVSVLKQFPASSGADVWLYLPKPGGALKSLGKLPIASLPVGPTVLTLRFTADGVRFDGLTTISRETATETASR
jgi:hypothetical protein